ncbi:MAG: DUF4359 domain-containing protein [Phormidesmis sp.]
MTNPTKEDYAAYLSQTLSEEAQVSLCQPEGFSEWLGKVGEVLSGACQEVIAGGKRLSAAEIQETLVANTERKERFFFSTYETKTPFGSYQAIGVFDRFIPQGTRPE